MLLSILEFIEKNIDALIELESRPKHGWLPDQNIIKDKVRNIEMRTLEIYQNAAQFIKSKWFLCETMERI